MQVLLNFGSGHPNYGWVQVRNIFVQGHTAYVQLNAGQQHRINHKDIAIAWEYIHELICTGHGYSSLEVDRVHGRDYTIFTANNCYVNFTVVLEY